MLFIHERIFKKILVVIKPASIVEDDTKRLRAISIARRARRGVERVAAMKQHSVPWSLPRYIASSGMPRGKFLSSVAYTR